MRILQDSDAPALAASCCHNHQQHDTSVLMVRAARVTDGKCMQEECDREGEGAVATAGSESLREFFAFSSVFIHLGVPE